MAFAPENVPGDVAIVKTPKLNIVKTLKVFSPSLTCKILPRLAFHHHPGVVWTR